MNKIMESTRDAYGDILAEIGKNEDIVVVDADLSVSTKTSKFRQKYPERFFNVGCAEQNLIATAAGLAIGGKTVFASTHTQFVLRAWELIRTIIAHDKLNVKIAVTHAGITNGVDGYTHHSTEDIALMRAIPELIVEVPADSIETRAVVKAAAMSTKPFFIRLNRTKTPVIFDDSYVFEIGKGVKLADGDDITIFATGTMVSKAMEAAELLKKKKIESTVVNIHTLKPLDRRIIVKEAKKTGRVLTVEEHNIIGGLGDAVGGVLIENHPDIAFTKMGIDDTFTESGPTEELYKKYGLTPDDIRNRALRLMEVDGNEP